MLKVLRNTKATRLISLKVPTKLSFYPIHKCRRSFKKAGIVKVSGVLLCYANADYVGFNNYLLSENWVDYVHSYDANRTVKKI